VLSACGSRYSRWERLAMGLALFNLLFVVVAILARPSPQALGYALLTWTPFTPVSQDRKKGQRLVDGQEVAGTK
jgi:hypothetical protein